MKEHEYFEQLCSNSIDGTLTDDERQELEAHLAECPSCAALLDDLREMQSLFAAEPQAVPDDLHQHIMDAVEQEQKLKIVQPVKPARRLPVFTMIAAAAVVVVVVLGGGVGQLFGPLGGMKGGADAAADGAASGDMVAKDPAEAGEAYSDAAIGDAAADAGLDGNEAAATGGTQPALNETVPQSDSASSADGAAPEAEEPALAAQAPAANKSGTTADSSNAAASSAPVPALRESTGETVPASLILPASLQGRTVAYCYMAEGTGELPDLGGSLLLTEGNTSYFSLQNNMSVIENTLSTVEKAGYTVSSYDDVGLVTDANVDSWLLIVRN